MNLLSEHNRILRVGEGGSQEYFAGPNINITDHVISGKYWDNEINSAISSTSGDIVNEAFNQSTAWTEEQGYLTAHQDVSNLPYVQNSALGYNGNLISSISGDGFFAESANNSYHADDADHATYADSATHADSADFVATANFANSASSALNAEVANVAYTALTANFLDGGWELDVDGFITAYNNSAFAGAGGGGIEYEGISPIVVDNEHHLISAESARLGVQNPLYFVEDSNTATVIGIYDSALSGLDWSDDITAASANAYNEAVNNITAVKSADSATYDNLGREITSTYLTGEVEYSAGSNIDITNHIVSGKDWTNDIQSASSYAYDQATAQIPAVTGLPYVENSALDYTPGGHLVSSISGDAIYAVSAECSFTAETANYSYIAETANYVADGWEYNESNEITGYSGSAIYTGEQSEGKIYTGVAPIVVDNSQTTGVISAQTARLGVQGPLYFVEDTSASTVIGISGLPEVEGLMYESALNFGDGYITGYNGSALSSERSRYAVSSTSANGAVSSQTAAIVTGGWESANGKITGYNGTAFSAGSTYDVKASTNINVATAGTTFTVSGKDWQNTITAASSYAYNQATANATGKYIPYTNITTGISGTTVYNVASGIRVTAASGWTEIYCQNKENDNEAHLQVGQNYSDGKSFWAELDGAGGGLLQMNWNSGTIVPNANSSYSDGTCSALDIGNGAIVYASATSALGNNYDSHKVWQLGSERVRFWNQWGTASFGPQGMEIYDSTGNNRWYTTAADGATRFRVVGSGQTSAGVAITGAVDLTPSYINFYDQSWNLRATLNYEEINALKALLNHVSTASASWVNPSTATGSI